MTEKLSVRLYRLLNDASERWALNSNELCLLDEARALVKRLEDAPFGMLATYPEANDRATYLYFNGKGLVPIGVECRLVATPASGGPRDG